jgi:Fe-S-cluster-containing hydrogenase component 2
MQLVINHDNCRNYQIKHPHCHDCVNACPERAITKKERVEIDASRCVGCGACVRICRAGSIKIK